MSSNTAPAGDLVALVQLLRRRGTDLPTVEVKAAGGGLPKSVRETLSAFSNDRGGTLILGLAEDRGFTRAPDFDAVTIRDNLASLCSDALEPPVRADIDIVDFEGGQLVVAAVPELAGAQKPCFVRARGMSGGSYTRGGDGDRLLTDYEIFLLHSNRGQPTDDYDVVPEVTTSDLDQDAVDRLLRRVRQREPRAFGAVDDTTALVRLGVLRRTDEGTGVTLAGLLTLGQWPQQFLPQLCITFIAVPATSKDALPADAPRFTDNATLRGSLPQIIDDAVSVILRNTRTAGVVQGTGRRDVSDYPVEVLREVVTNAVAHRDYSPLARGTQVQVELYLDRLVVRSPGGLFGAVTPDDLGREGVSSSRNSHLVPLLADVFLPGTDRVVVDNRGSGIPDMLGRLRRAGLTLPAFDVRLSSFTVTFPQHTLLTPETLEWIRSLGQTGLSQAQVNALALLREGRRVSNATLRQLGSEGREATAALADLVARGLTQRVGGRRYAEHVLDVELTGQQVRFDGLAAGGAATATPGEKAPARRRDRSEEIMRLFDDGEAHTAKHVAEVSGLALAMTNRYLGQLVGSGRLVPTAPPRSPRRAYRVTPPST